MGVGRSLGERGVIRREPRSLTAYAKTRTYLLSLSDRKFNELLGKSIYFILEQKRKFIEDHLPYSTSLSYVHKEKIACAMTLSTHLKGKFLAVRGKPNSTLFFVAEGE
jgi:hypothetical protein